MKTHTSTKTHIAPSHHSKEYLVRWLPSRHSLHFNIYLCNRASRANWWPYCILFELEHTTNIDTAMRNIVRPAAIISLLHRPIYHRLILGLVASISTYWMRLYFAFYSHSINNSYGVWCMSLSSSLVVSFFFLPCTQCIRYSHRIYRIYNMHKCIFSIGFLFVCLLVAKTAVDWFQIQRR